VRDVTRGARFARDGGTGGKFGEIRVPRGLVDQSAGHAERAVLDGFAYELRLRVELLTLEPAVAGAADARARRAEADERGDIASDAAAFDRAEEFIERRPVDVEPVRARSRALRTRASP